MEKFSNIQHPLTRDGTSQNDRRLERLAPSSIQISGQETIDTLAFVFRYAAQICYYDTDLQKDDWSLFFQRSIPVQLALINQFDTESLQKDFRHLLDVSSKMDRGDGLVLLADFLLDVALQINGWESNLRSDFTGFNIILKNIITNDLAPALKRIFGVLAGAKIIIDNGENQALLRFDPREKGQAFLQNRIWNLTGPDLTREYETTLQLKGSQRYKIRTITEEYLDLFEIFRKAILKLTERRGSQVSQLKEAFNRSFTGTDRHEPHLSLFYAFLKLFDDIKQGQLNLLTQKHLDFFYRRILKFQYLPLVPDKAHLVFELSPGQVDQRVKEGTDFSGGQDKNGEEIIFRSGNELIVNSAKVASVKTVFVDREIPSLPDECFPDEEEPAKGAVR